MPMAVACSAAFPTIGNKTNPTNARGKFQANAAPSIASQMTFDNNDMSKVNKANQAIATFGANTNSSSSSSSSSGYEPSKGGKRLACAAAKTTCWKPASPRARLEGDFGDLRTAPKSKKRPPTASCDGHKLMACL